MMRVAALLTCFFWGPSIKGFGSPPEYITPAGKYAGPSTESLINPEVVPILTCSEADLIKSYLSKIFPGVLNIYSALANQGQSEVFFYFRDQERPPSVVHRSNFGEQYVFGTDLGSQFYEFQTDAVAQALTKRHRESPTKLNNYLQQSVHAILRLVAIDAIYNLGFSVAFHVRSEHGIVFISHNMELDGDDGLSWRYSPRSGMKAYTIQEVTIKELHHLNPHNCYQFANNLESFLTNRST